MSGANTISVLARFCDNNWERGKYFVKTFFRQKTCVGEGGERERALDDVFGIWVTVRSCWEKLIKTKLCKKSLKSPTIAKVLENKFRQVVEKPPDLILCLFGFVKATKFRDSSEYSQCVQIVLAKSCLPCQILYKQKKIFC